MLASLRELGRTALALAVTRGRLAASEIEEQAIRVAEILVWALLALMLLGVAIVFGAVMIVLLFWDENRLLATGLVALVLALGCAAAAWLAVLRIRERPPLLEN